MWVLCRWGFVVLCGDTGATLLNTGVREERHLLQARQVDKWLDGAADVNESEANGLHVAAKNIWGVVVLKGEQCYWW